MSQQSFHQQTANGNDINFTITTFSSDEIKVYVDGVLKTAGADYNINPYNSSGQSTVDWIGTAPASPSVVRVIRQTDVMNNGNTAVEGKAVFQPGSSVKADDLNNNTKQALRAIKENQEQLVQSYDFEPQSVNTAALKDLNVTRGKLANDAIDGTKIADDTINSEHYVAGSIDHEHLANDIIDGDNIQDSVINSEHYVDGSIDREHLASDIVDGTKIADDSINSEHYVAASIDHEHLANDIIDGDNIQDDVINSEHYVAGSIDHEHLANDIIDGDNIQDDVINSEHYAPLSIDTEHIANVQVTTAKLANDAVTSAKLADDAVLTANILNDNVTTDKIADDAVTNAKIADGTLDGRYYTETELDAGQLDNRYFTETELTSGALDGRYFTETEADARYFNISTGDTIKDGDTFPDNDTTIATTAAINDRIIDLVDDVGGFVPIANETSFPTANPDVNDGAGTLVSIKEISSTRTPSTGTVTIANGSGSNTVTITGCGSTVLTAGFGVIVETTTTLHTYAFHRLVPKATEVTTVAGISSNVTTVATNIADINTVAADLNEGTSEIDTVATNIANVNTVGNAIANVNTTAGSIANVNTTAGSIANVNTTAGSISNVNSVAGSIANVNTTASNLANINNFAATYQIASSAPSTDGAGNALAAGDLYFDTSANELRVHNGTTFQGGVTATGNLAGLGANSFTGNQTIQNNLPKLFLTDANNNSDFSVQNANGVFTVHDETNTADRLTINSAGLLTVPGNLDANGGLDVTGNITVTGNVDGRDVAADGTKLDGIATGAIANVVEDTSPQLGGNLASNGNHVLMADNDQIRLGALPDVRFYHDGSHSYLTNATGHLRLRSDSFKIEDQTSGHSMITAVADGAVELYYDNSKKLETLTSGIQVTGNITVSGTVDGVDIAALNTTVSNITTDLVSDTSPQLGGDLDTNDHNINIDDNHRVNFGDSSDLHLIHDGTNSYLQNTTGVLYINNTSGTASNLIVKAASNVELQPNDGNSGVKCVSGGATELYHNNVKKAETMSGGLSVTGQVAVAGTGVSLSIADNGKAAFGTGDDLKIYHTGVNGLITNTTGNLELQTNNSILLQKGNSEFLAKFISDGACELYHDNSKKLQTQSGGVRVFGDLENHDDNFVAKDNAKFVAGNSDDLQIYHDGSKSLITESGTGHLEINTNNLRIQNAAANETLLYCTENGSVQLYHDNSKKAETYSAGLLITGTLSVDTGNIVGNDNAKLKLGSSDDLQIYHDATHSRIANTTGTLVLQSDAISLTNNAGNSNRISTHSSGEVKLYYSDSAKLETTNTGVTVTGNFAMSGGFNGNLVPDADSSRNLGANGTRWANLYADTLYGDGSNLTGISAGAQGGGSDEIFWCNGQTVTSDFTIPNGKNAMSAGPITINSGITVTVGAGETWTVV